MSYHLIIEGKAVYEVDEECMAKKNRKKEEKECKSRNTTEEVPIKDQRKPE